MRPGLLAWQWHQYPRNHRDRVSLLVHIVTVPVFIAGVLAALRLATMSMWAGALIALAVAVLAFAAQGAAHRREAEPPEPFQGPGDALARILAEQFVTFPRFVLTGGWVRAMGASESKPQD